MNTAKPRVNQWVIYGDKLQISKVEDTLRKYYTSRGKPWGPVVKVFVRRYQGLLAQRMKPSDWYPVERTRVITPKEAKKLLETPL